MCTFQPKKNLAALPIRLSPPHKQLVTQFGRIRSAKYKQYGPIFARVRQCPLEPNPKNSRPPHFQQPLESCPSVLRRPTEIRSCGPPHRWLGRLPHDQIIIFPPQHHIMNRAGHSRKILRNAHESDHIRLPRAGCQVVVSPQFCWMFAILYVFRRRWRMLNGVS